MPGLLAIVMRVYTDWVLIHRLALELASRYTGARVQAAGQLADGRFALQLWQRGTLAIVAFDVFAPTPVITVEDAELEIQAEPGFIRRTGAALRGMTVTSVTSRRGDRVLRLEFGARSRFGVQSGSSLISELVPRFGNLLLVKDQTIVAALKEFTPLENAQRSVAAGDLYEPPPLSLKAHGSEGEFIAALTAREAGVPPSRAIVSALRALVPLLPQMVALSLLTQAFAEHETAAPEVLATAVLRQTDAFFVRLEHLRELPLNVYRDDDGGLVQAHVVPLHQFDDLPCEQTTELLPVLCQSRLHSATRDTDRIQKQRRVLARTLKDRDERVKKELRDVENNLARGQERDSLREQGREIFATLHELGPQEQEAAKAQAAATFARYEKLSASIPHLQSRQAELERTCEAVRDLQWELERASDDDLEDVAEAVASLDGRPQPARSRRKGPKRKPLTVTTATGSRILIGRSPVENAELTFHTARPDDLWFHAQKIPGAHVILQRDDREPPAVEDIRLAASFAAFYSKAQSSPKVLIDYTLRKYVRKQPAAPPGLVFYTHPKSILVEPQPLKI